MEFIRKLKVQELSIDNGRWKSYRVVVYLTTLIDEDVKYVDIYKNEENNQLLIKLSDKSKIPDDFLYYKTLKVKDIKINEDVVRRITVYITKFYHENDVKMYYDKDKQIVLLVM